MPVEPRSPFSLQHPSAETAESQRASSTAKASATTAVRSRAHEAAAVREILDEVLEPAPFRRDFNLIREILLEAEQPGGHPFTYPGYDRNMVQAHLLLLIEAGYAHGTIVRNGNGLTTASLERLTWTGHDLLALLKDPGLWQQAQASALDSHGCAHTDLLVQWLKSQTSPR